MMIRWKKSLGIMGVLALIMCFAGPVSAKYWPVTADTVVDLSPTYSMTHYQNWPGGGLHHPPIIVPYHKHGPGPWASDLLIIDENTATQTDTPTHMMSPQDSGLPNAGYWGDMTAEKVPAWQFVGEVFKIDGRGILDQAPNGRSPIFTVDMAKATERADRDFRPGDAVLYWSGYDDKYDKPVPEGRRLIVDPIAGTSPVWPAPDFEAADYVGSKGVWLMGIDSPSMGAFGPPKHSLPGPAGMFQNPLALESHLGHFKHGAIHTEGLMNLHRVPNGSGYVALYPKHKDSPTVETRAAAITDLKLAKELMKAIRARRVVDLSVINSMQHPVWWPGAGVGNYLFPYTVVNPVNYFTGPFGPYWVNTHIMDAHTGTHLDPPAHFGPPPGFDFNSYDSWTKGVLKKFKSKYGDVKTTDMTSDKVPIHYFMGPARVVNVQHLVGTTDPNTWPAAPAIKVEHIKAHEKRYGAIKAGEVVIFHTGHTDAHFGPFKRGLPELTVKAPLDGQSEGWPAPTADAVLYLAKKGVKHIAIDAPSMGSVRGEEAVMTHWAAANKGMIFTEYLIGVGQLPPTGAFFIFLNPKIENNHGGPGRAIAILP